MASQPGSDSGVPAPSSTSPSGQRSDFRGSRPASASDCRAASREDSEAVRVARSRFLPVKKTSDLLLLMSDVYVLEDSGVIKRSGVGELPEIDLDDAYFANISAFSERFPEGVPSLIQCSRLSVVGDVRFGKNVTLIGEVELTAPSDESLLIEDDAVLGAN